MDEQLDQRHRQVVRDRRPRVGVLPGAPEHVPIVNRATGAAESPSMRTTCASGPGSSRSVAAKAAPSAIAHGSGLVSAPRSEARRAVSIERSSSARERWLCDCGEGDAHRAGDDEVDQDRADHRPGGVLAEQRDQQRHAHEAGVRERGDEGAERGVAQLDAVLRPARRTVTAIVRAMIASAATT